MKIIITTALIIGFQLSAFSQSLTIPLSEGGSNDGGTILNIDLTGNYTATPMVGMTEANESNISSIEPEDLTANGLYYESTNNSLYISEKTGARTPFFGAYGSIVKYNITTKVSQPIVHFKGELGEHPLGSPVKVGNKLYGVTALGGTNDLGVIFSIDILSDEYEVLHNFDGTNGGRPTCPLFVDNGILYGSTKTQGANPFTIFSYNPGTASHVVLHSDAVATTTPTTGLMIRSGIIYFNRGVDIDQINLSGASYISWFTGQAANEIIGTDGVDFTLGGDGSWYTTFLNGGGATTDYGSIAKMDFGSGAPVKIHSFQSGSLGETSIAKLTPGLLSNELYGIATGTNDLLYKVTTSGAYTILKEFNVDLEGRSIKSQLVLANNKLYGIAEDKGEFNAGTIWSFDLGTQTFAVESQLGYENGKSPFAAITEHPTDNSLNFITYQGTESNTGAYSSFDMSTGNYSKNTNIASASFTQLFSKPIYFGSKTFFIGEFAPGSIASENSLNGLIEFNTTTGDQTAIKGIAPNAAVLEQLKTPSNSNYIQDGANLYGASYGFIWKFDLNTNTYTTLHTLTTVAKFNTRHSIVKVGTSLYGSYLEDGTGEAVVYSLDETGTSFTELFRGNGHQYLGLVNDGNEIYAVKQNNLTSFDTLVSMNIATPPASFTNHLALDSATIGIDFDGTLKLVGSDIYGVLNQGGTDSKGGIFKFTPDAVTPSNSVVSSLISFDNTTGHNAILSELYYSTSTVGIEQLESKNSILVYPNPATDYLTVDSEKVTLIEIYSVSGKLLQKKRNSNQIDVRKLNNGTYIIKVEINNELFTSKLIKN